MPRRRATTAAEILAAASTLLAEQGATAVHIVSVARLCGVSVGTIYNYFSSKEHLLTAVARVVEHDFVTAMERAAPPGRPLRPAVPALTAGLLRVATTSPLARLLHDLPGVSPGQEPGGALIRQWVADRVARAQAAGEVGAVDPSTVAELAFALVRAGLPTAATPEGADRLQPLLAAGLAALLLPPAAPPPTSSAPDSS